MAKVDKRAAEIVLAAQAIEDEIAHIEAISRSLRKAKLTSDKTIARAAAELKETLALPERLADRLQAVAAALARMQERQQAALEPLAAFAVEIQKRAQLFEKHMHTFGALGKAAADVSAQLEASERKPPALARAETQLRKISEMARALFEAARADDFPEIAREADVLKQRMAAMSKRLRRPG